MSPPGTPRIVLVRHGRSAHVHDGRWMTPDGVRDFERAYNFAGGFRRIVADRLRARGWRAEPGRLSYANWSTWSYSPPI